MNKTIRLTSLPCRTHLLSLILIPLLMLFSASGALAQESEPQIHITQVDKSRFPQVTVYVSVVNEMGEPVGIDPASIQIQEKGQVMQLMVDVPGPVNFNFNFGFPPGKAYACMAETIALALEGRFEDYTLGKHLTRHRVEEIPDCEEARLSLERFPFVRARGDNTAN